MGKRSKAEAELLARQEGGHAEYPAPQCLRPRSLRRMWIKTQARFVDSPLGAVAEADTLVAEVMTRRAIRWPTSTSGGRRIRRSPAGFPSTRDAHSLAERSRRGEATRKSCARPVHYRALFEELLGWKKESWWPHAERRGLSDAASSSSEKGGARRFPRRRAEAGQRARALS